MILSNIKLPSKAGLCMEYSGIDSVDQCRDPQWFQQWSWPIQYSYNSRGFRDSEWPSDLSQVIWCVGDSFTVGIGSPRTHTWPWLLQQRTGLRTINISMDGASNNWICRTAQNILQEFPQAQVAVHWSYIHRRELSVDAALEKKFAEFYAAVKDPQWPVCAFAEYDGLPALIRLELEHVYGWQPVVYDDDRSISHVRSSHAEDLENAKFCITQLPPKVIQSSIPRWMPAHLRPSWSNSVIATPQLDWARDWHHYDIKTSSWLVDKIISTVALHATV